MRAALNERLYLENRLNAMVKGGTIARFKVGSTDKNHGKSALIIMKHTTIRLDTDFSSYIEIVIGEYFRYVTDYIVGDFKDALDWHLDLIDLLAAKDYVVKTRWRGNRAVARYLILGTGKSVVTLGDYQNHFTLFSRTTLEKGPNLIRYVEGGN
jgi:hypothetical protein